MAVDLTSFDAMLKEYFTNDKVMNLCNKDQPLMAWMPRMTEFYGDSLPIPIQYALGAGHSHTFTSAQANKNGGKYKSFALTRKKFYSLLSLDNETMMASESMKGAWAEARTREIETLFQGNAELSAKDLVTNFGGALARGASLASTTLTLTNPEDTVHFWEGQVLQSSTADGTSGSVKSGTATVSAVDRDAGTITASFGGITSFAATDYIFLNGSFGQAMHGLESWLPWAAPTSGDSHFGVDRSVDPTRLSGIRFDATNYDTIEGIERALARFRREQAYPETIFINHQRFMECSLDLGSQYQRTQVKVGDNAYDTITFNNNGRKVRLVADQNIPYIDGFALKRDTWKWYTLGKAPHFPWKANNNSIPEPTADAIEIRVGWYGNLGCRAPGQNGRIRFAA